MNYLIRAVVCTIDCKVNTEIYLSVFVVSGGLASCRSSNASHDSHTCGC